MNSCNTPMTTLMLLISRIYAGVLRGHRRHDEKEQRIGGSVQCEIKKTMNEHSKASGQRAGRYPSPEFIVRLPSCETLAKENNDKRKA